MEEAHEIIGNLLMSLVGLHVAAAIVLSKLENTNLVAAMITGTKKFK